MWNEERKKIFRERLGRLRQKEALEKEWKEEMEVKLKEVMRETEEELEEEKGKRG